MIPPTNNWW